MKKFYNYIYLTFIVTILLVVHKNIILKILTKYSRTAKIVRYAFSKKIYSTIQIYNNVSCEFD